jgi:hypothetical protein
MLVATELQLKQSQNYSVHLDTASHHFSRDLSCNYPLVLALMHSITSLHQLQYMHVKVLFFEDLFYPTKLHVLDLFAVVGLVQST